MKKKQNIKRSRKIRNTVVVCSLFAILLSASTYAWFIGMKTVSVDKFDIDIATTEGLFLSMNGKDWSYSLKPNDISKYPSYENNANTWAPDGLIPMSSVGDMDITSSRMKLYQKASLSAVTGGYRFLASRVDNHSTKNAGGIEYNEGKGYVAFDLFIKNLSGEEYYETNNPLNEEAIYLTYNSEVKVSDNGGVANTGIENSVRVGIVQIGRVIGDGTASVDAITKITCTDGGADADKVTGICRNAQIWEPNDTKHVQNAINWYDESCLVRTGEDVNDKGSYDTGKTDACSAVENGTAYKTYAISRELNVADNVNIYDGEDYNTYTDNTMTYEDYLAAPVDGSGDTAGQKLTAKLVDFPYFTDTMKMDRGNARKPFMTLAPNSITKVRVYVWIEGQDVDNYDFAQLGKKISISFGFTKERYEETDFPDYDGPNTDITGTTLAYEATGTVKLSEDAIADGVQYNTSIKAFIIPKDYTEEFTFTDNDTPKTATHDGDIWTIA